MEENKVEEIKEENEVATEAAIENKTEVTPNMDGFIEAIDISNPNDVETKVDDARKQFKDAYKKVTKRNKILGGIAFVMMMGIVIVGWFFPKIIQVAFIAVAVVFVGMLIYTRISRKQMDKEVGAYLYEYGKNTDSYVYNNKEVSNIKMNFKEKPDEETIRAMNFAKDIVAIGSRDKIVGRISNTDFEVGDASIKVGQAKDRRTHKTVFVGKVLSFDISVNDNGRVLMYLEGCGDAKPDALDDVNEVSVDELSNKWKVYSSNDNYNKIFNKAFVSALNHFTTDEIMNDMIISITNNKFIIGLSYADSMMIIPLDSEFKMTGIAHYKEDIEKVVELVKAVEKNSYLK